MPPKRKRAASKAEKSKETTPPTVRTSSSFNSFPYFTEFHSQKKEKVQNSPEPSNKKSKTSEAHVISVDHCTSWSVFKRKANDIFAEIVKLIADKNFELALNAGGKPARGSFEIFVTKSGSEEKVQIWSGMKKGPPRKDKFPEPKDLVQAILDAIKE